MKNGDSHGDEAVEEKITENDETREPEETLEGETNSCQVTPEESEEHRTATEEKKIKEEESFEDEKSTQSECTRELQGVLEDGAVAVHILPGETSAVNLHTVPSTMPSEVKGNETEETELKEAESLEKIREQTRDIKEVSNFNETCGRASDNDLLTETEDAANGKKIVITNYIAVIEVLKEEVMEDKEVTETSYSTSHLEEVIEDGSGEIELKDKLIQDNKLIVEVQKTSENEIIEYQIENCHASISRIETIAVTEENVELEPPGFEEKPESDLEPVVEDQSNETLPEHTKSKDDETTTNVQNQETEEQIKEELKDKVEAEGSINGEQNKNDVTKAVILSEEVDGSEDIKEHVIEEESSTNELHPAPKGDETTNEVENCSSVSIERIEAAESEERIQAGNSEDEENSTNNKEGSHITEELDERRQDEESGDPVNVHGENREAEEKVEIVDDLKLNHDKSHSEAVTEETAETSLNDTQVNKELVNTSNISSAKMSLKNIESDANQETEEVEKVQLEERSSDLAPEVPTNNNNEEEVIKRDPDMFYMSEYQIEEANNDTTEKLEGDKVEIEGVPEPLSDSVPPRVETIPKDDSTSTNTFQEE
ncbi:aspartic and glutamic acid-rich protein-like [Hibiscus syriacus]|uniref:aspartic and glutamic acid-rich protein-like n=1 Tax=Hibiscus syriacus TaxID=106335 RepID=UPI001922952D|nr:aspartic and glutamic acid-rich protein-like [Hibiscus syriacus]